VKECIILVDHNDNNIGSATKLLAHTQALLHRAFSVFIFRHTNSGLELLLQQRALGKYHSAELWTNTCCGHPAPDESTLISAKKRLFEEMNIHLSLQEVGAFHYKQQINNKYWENEIDHLFIGYYTEADPIIPNIKEVMDFKWMNLPSIESELKTNSHQFTVWFAQALNIILSRKQLS
jgi:isopentenyl-diphosphate delta-isomerase type 1